jgi:hypothetical protein
MNTLRNLSFATLLVARALLLPDCAWAGEDITVAVPPPPPHAERQPPHRDGYVWAPGCWEWDGHFFRWTSGTWITERPGHWVASHWDPIGNQWHYVKGHWER